MAGWAKSFSPAPKTFSASFDLTGCQISSTVIIASGFSSLGSRSVTLEPEARPNSLICSLAKSRVTGIGNTKPSASLIVSTTLS